MANKYEHSEFSQNDQNSFKEQNQANYTEKKIKGDLLKRTVGTALISSFVTFSIMALILIYLFVSLLAPTIFDRQASITFSDDEETVQASIKLNEMMSIIRDNYYEELTDAQILDAMAQGLPSALGNPYTYYLDKESYQQITESMEGEYVGIGCTVTLTEEGWTQVVEVYPDSPALEAGLKSQDYIVSVDGVDVRVTKDTNTTASLVRGEEGTTVTIEVIRGDSNEPLEFEIERRTIKSQNLKFNMLDDNTGYIHINAFAEGVEVDFVNAMDKLQEEGAKNIVFDLRYNSGGRADVMIAMLDYLLPKDTVLATIRGRDSGTDFEIDWITENDASVPDDMNYAILTNSHSASASEFFSGCLRDYGKATIIGQTTFGKGSGTSSYKLPDGSAINVTIFKYYLPGGELVEGNGIEPDIEEVIKEEYEYTSIQLIPQEEDNVIAKALEQLD